jgi:hypothetical protein
MQAIRRTTREQLRQVLTPPGTDTHRPVPHIDFIEAVEESLAYRQIQIVQEEFALSGKQNRMWGVLELHCGMAGARFAIAVRNAHDRHMKLGMTLGYRVLSCNNLGLSGEYHAVMMRHVKKFNLLRAVTLAVDQLQRSFAPLTSQIEAWKRTQLGDDMARTIIYRAFIEQGLGVPARLGPMVHAAYFAPVYEEFRPRTLWSLSNAFTSAFQDLFPIPMYQAAGALASFLSLYQPLDDGTAETT